MTDPTASPDVLLISADLFLGSRIRGAVEAAGRSIDVAATGPAALDRLKTGNYRLALIDLETPQLDLTPLMRCRTNTGRPAFVAYGPHVKTQLLGAARKAGCDEVLPRGRFDATLHEMLTRYSDM